VINVIDKVVAKEKCCGCGVCTGIAPKCNLSMVFNVDGEFNPIVTNCNECKICLSICPFSEPMVNNLSEAPLGNSIANYVGYSKVGSERARGSSGGMATRVLKALLERKMVDGIVAVTNSNTDSRLFETTIIRTPEDVSKCSGSKYYPVEFSGVLKQIKNETGTFAIIGLPCVVIGLRKVQKQFPEIGNKIKYILGLTCGHNKNKNYVSMLLRYLKTNESAISAVSFRNKDNSIRASNFGFSGQYKMDGSTKVLYFQNSIIKHLWCRYFFAVNSCFYCKDVFAEQADISFMDAWLQPYADDPLGTSLIVVRNMELNALLQNEKDNDKISMEVVDNDTVIKSQDGVIGNKDSDIAGKRMFIFNRWFSNKMFSQRKNKYVGLLLVLVFVRVNQMRIQFLLIYAYLKRKVKIFLKEVL